MIRGGIETRIKMDGWNGPSIGGMPAGAKTQRYAATADDASSVAGSKQG